MNENEQTAPASTPAPAPAPAPAVPPAPAPAVFIPGIPATPPAPVAAPAPAPAPVVAPLGPVVPNSGDPLIDAALTQFAGSAKLSDSDFHGLFDNVLKTGDLGQLDQLALAEKLGTEKARQAVSLMQGVSQRVHERAASIGSQIHEMTGGKENWVRAVEAFNASQPDFVKTQIQMMLGSGDPAQLQYAVNQVMSGASASGAIPATHSTAGAPPAGAMQGALDANGFRQGLAEIRKKYGTNASLESGPAAAEFAALRQRRSAGRSAGL